MRDHLIAMAVETIDPGRPWPPRDLRTRGAGRRDGVFVAESREVGAPAPRGDAVPRPFGPAHAGRPRVARGRG